MASPSSAPNTSAAAPTADELAAAATASTSDDPVFSPDEEAVRHAYLLLIA